MSSPSSIAFGPFRLEERERILWRDTVRVPLTAKPFEILLLLVRNAGRVVSKDEFLREIWPDVVVSEGNLKQNVALLRKSLEEAEGDAAWIEAVPRVGYRWIGPATPAGVASPVPEALPPSGAIVPEARADARGELVRRVWLRRSAAAVVVAASLSFAAFLSNRATERRADGLEGDRHRSGAVLADPPTAARIATERGRYYWNRRTDAGLKRSLALFERAIALAPGYAPAYAGLADACVFDLARRADAVGHARRALELDPTLAQPHATLGFAAMFHDWSWAEARGAFAKALESDPENVPARQWLALWHALRGDHGSARAEIDRAVSIDPVALPVLADAAELAFLSGDEDRALVLVREGLELDGEFINLHQVSMRIAARQRRDADWLAEKIAVARLSGGAANRQRTLEAAFDLGGYDAVLGEEEKRLSGNGGDPYALAEIRAALGDRNGALAHLERAVASRSFHCVYLGVEPAFAPLRDEPRFQALLARLGLPVASG